MLLLDAPLTMSNSTFSQYMTFHHPTAHCKRSDHPILLPILIFCCKNFYSWNMELFYNWDFLPEFKGQIMSNWYPRILPKNERTNSFLLLWQICSLVFWENSRIPRSPFEIIWPLAVRKWTNYFPFFLLSVFIWDFPFPNSSLLANL